MKEHPVFARVYGVLQRLADRAERPYRAETAGGARGAVLEVGAGGGANLEHYPASVRPVLIEPDPHMLKGLRGRARDGAASPSVVRGAAEALPFRDGAFDTVVCSLVLCSVRDPARAAGEIRRVLAPGGELRFFEHVRSGDPSLARKQDRWQPLWSRFGGGCRPNRDTVSTLRDAGFGVRFRPWHLRGGWIAAPHVVGTARPDA